MSKQAAWQLADSAVSQRLGTVAANIYMYNVSQLFIIMMLGAYNFERLVFFINNNDFHETIQNLPLQSFEIIIKWNRLMSVFKLIVHQQPPCFNSSHVSEQNFPKIIRPQIPIKDSYAMASDANYTNPLLESESIRDYIYM